MEVTSNYKMIDQQTMIYKVLTMLCGSITLMTFYAVGKKWLTRFQRKTRKREKRVQIERTNDVDGLHDAKICVVCQENPRKVALFPCGHVCVCGDCSLLIKEICPICRGPVGEILTIYLSWVLISKHFPCDSWFFKLITGWIFRNITLSVIVYSFIPSK